MGSILECRVWSQRAGYWVMKETSEWLWELQHQELINLLSWHMSVTHLTWHGVCALSSWGFCKKVTSHLLVQGEWSCGRDSYLGFLLYWGPFSEHENEPGSHSMGYHFSIEEKRSAKIDHFRSKVIFGSALPFLWHNHIWNNRIYSLDQWGKTGNQISSNFHRYRI